MTLGFLGTGAITSAIVTGLRAQHSQPSPIHLSPRNSRLAATLATRFDNVHVCASNQDVIHAADTIILAIRPQIAEEVLSTLHFSRHHAIVSLVAGFSTARIGRLTAPAANISRAIPLPSVAGRRSPIAIYPACSPATELFDALGKVFEMEVEDHLNAFSTATSTMAAYFGFAGHIASWVTGKGIPESVAREYVAWMFAGLGRTGIEASSQTFSDLAAAHATPGGLNEQVLRDLTNDGIFEALTAALDSVHRRATGQRT